MGQLGKVSGIVFLSHRVGRLLLALLNASMPDVALQFALAKLRKSHLILTIAHLILPCTYLHKEGEPP